jgi:hypothetical protein
MPIAKSAIIVGLCLSLQGCFWFFIWTPGMSDALTGAEGEHCVGDNAYVGQKIKLADGRVGTVEKLSGISSRCQTPAWPIRAKLSFDSEI